jgi:hypothetical protein
MLALDADATRRRPQVIVLGNEKGGSGKSTTAMHLIVAMRRVAGLPHMALLPLFRHSSESRNPSLHISISDHGCRLSPA